MNVRRRVLPALLLVTTAAAGLVATMSASTASAVEGGRTTTAGAAPYAMLIESAAGAEHCGGTLIAPTKVLTAAHCVSPANGVDAKSLLVVGGRTTIKSTAGQVRHVASVRIDPKFDLGALTHDAAVITLDRPLPYKPLPLAPAGNTALYKYGNKATVFGWGVTGPGPVNGLALATQLKTARLTLAPLSACDPFYNPPVDTAALKVCGRPGPGTADSICAGDSGGPLVEGGYLIGIVSTGNHFCDGEYPASVFTKVTAIEAGLGLTKS